MNDIFVSVGLPTFNSEKYLKQAIDSILCQTHTNFELIITDDGSTDTTLEIIGSYRDSRIRVYTDLVNKGIAFRLNQQIKLARGKYFFRMDSDDVMVHNRIELQINFLETNPEIDIIGSSAIIIDEVGKEIGYRYVQNGLTQISLFDHSAFIHPTVAGRIEWFKKILYDTELNGVEDTDLWIRNFGHSKYHNLEFPTIYYRDPLILRLKTYRFRMKQLRKMYIKNSHLIKRTQLFKLIMRSIFKETIILLSHEFGFSNLILSKRNQKIF